MPKKYERPDEDKWYRYYKIKPPERTSHGITEDEIDDFLAKQLEGHRHDWEQRGSELVCVAGDNEHGKRIGVQVRLAGTDRNGNPILVPHGPILRSEVEGG